ncbi:kinetochore Sim4 complex subunit FTA2-domain-containing protein [Hypoxylon argillaceum]|nr:kinetochore Sim4 complex subunit FTA2-domain-containing protein [Hypoxylon argillaceum]
MYPDWPECVADLRPLPQCPGPKLGPFDFQGPQKIEFIEKIGEGSHAIVFKVMIQGQIYALKVFRWIYDYNWIGYGDFINRDQPEGLGTVYNYMEPFNAECRAFGRLQEAGCEELAVSCFGYVLLDEDHERAMMTKFNFNQWSFNGDMDEAGFMEHEEQRLLYPGKNGKPPPFRCIVKAFGKSFDEDRGDVFKPRVARQLLRTIIKLQKLGIIQIDPAIRQVMDSKLFDFSTAITFPHFMTNPELNPHLSPAMVVAIKRGIFEHCMNDFIGFDAAIREWNWEYGRDRGHLSIEAFPGRGGCPLKARYNLRGGRGGNNTLYTFVDPRRYGWTANQGIKVADALSASQRIRAGRISKKVVARQSGSGRDRKILLRKPTGRPDMWYYQCEEGDKEWAKNVESSAFEMADYVQWEYKGGYMFPVKYGINNIN